MLHLQTTGFIFIISGFFSRIILFGFQESVGIGAKYQTLGTSPFQFFEYRGKFKSVLNHRMCNEDNDNVNNENKNSGKLQLFSIKQYVKSDINFNKRLQLSTLFYGAASTFLLLRSSNENKEYEALHHTLFRSYLTPGMKVLEVGFGGGANLEYYPGDIELVGIDPSFPSNSAVPLEDTTKIIDNDLLFMQQKKLYASKSIELNSLIKGSAESLPFPDSSFDAVVTTLVMCTVKDPQKAIQEISRVLKPGGFYIFVEHIIADDEGVNVNNEYIDSSGISQSQLKQSNYVGTKSSLKADLILSEQQKLLDPLQVLVADGCHLNRRTDKLILQSVKSIASRGDRNIENSQVDDRNSTLFSNLLQLNYQNFGSQWPISRQVFGALKK